MATGAENSIAEQNLGEQRRRSEHSVWLTRVDRLTMSNFVDLQLDYNSV